jgi:uncharacterized protein
MRLLAFVAFAVIALVALLFFGQRALVFPVPRPSRTPSSGELLRLPSTVATWLAPAPGQPVLVHFHGNGEQLADLDGVTTLLHQQGFGVLAVEYPGYGLAPGSPSETSLLRAGEEAVSFARDRLGIPPERLVLQGQSLGSGVAAALAARGRTARLVLISPYTSVADLSRQVIPLVPLGWLVRDRFDTRAIAPYVATPVLIVHGDRDEVIPFAMGEQLAAAFPNARLHRIAGGDHNDLWSEHVDELIAVIGAFTTPVAR